MRRFSTNLALTGACANGAPPGRRFDPVIGRVCRMAGDNEQSGDTRQRRDDVLRDTGRKITLFRIAAHISERQHSDRRRIVDSQWRFIVCAIVGQTLINPGLPLTPSLR